MHTNRWNIVLVLVLLGATAAWADTPRAIQRVKDVTRLALVVGNDAYAQSPLTNAVNDARAMRRLLEELDFEVLLLQDVKQRAFDQGLDDFIARLGANDIGLFYYAGHGVQIDGLNYLIPVDFRGSDPLEVKYRSVPADLVRERMEAAGTRLNILVFDACRNNPFRGTRSFGTGLAQMETGVGTFVAFSTAPGQTASDNSNSNNGLFTRHLINTMQVEGLSLDQVFNTVRRRVYEASSGSQTPWTSSSLIGDFYFRPGSRPTALVRPLEPRSGLRGHLAITGNVDGAFVYLDGKEVESHFQDGTIYVPEIPIGRHDLRLRKLGYLDYLEMVLVESELPTRIDVQLEPLPELPRSPQTSLVPPDAPPSAWVYTKNSLDPFCRTLEKIVADCPHSFRNLVDPDSSDAKRTLMEPSVVFMNAWYTKLFQLGPGKSRFISSFRAISEGGSQVPMEAYVGKVESCLKLDVVVDRRLELGQQIFDIVVEGQPCEIAIADKGTEIDIAVSIVSPRL